jgi:pteridine reductase
MSHNTKNKTALVTGGALRIGSEVVKYYNSIGYNVAIHYNKSNNDVVDLVTNLANKNVLAKAYQADFCDEQSTTKLVKNVFNDFGQIDLLVNNASIFSKSNPEKFNEHEFDKNFSIHVKAPLILTSELHSQCKSKNIKSNVVNIIDASVSRSKTSYFYYMLSKKTLFELTKMMAVEFAPHIRVNGVMPGYVVGAQDEDEKYLQELIIKNPLSRKAEVEDIISCIEYFNSQQYINGETIKVDGGYSLL